MFAATDETAILATESRTLAIGLSALLLSIPPIHHVKLVPDADALYDAIEETRPLLIVIDLAMIDRIAKLIDIRKIPSGQGWDRGTCRRRRR